MVGPGFEGCSGGTIPAHPRKKSKSYGANLEKVAKTRFHRRTKCTLENNIRLFPSVYVRFQILQKCVLHGTWDYSV